MKMSTFANPAFLTSWGKIFSPSKELPPRLAYKADLVNDYLTSQNKKFLELREALIKKHATKDDRGEIIIKEGNVEFKQEVLQAVNSEFAELMELELEPAIPSKLKLDDLEKAGVTLAGPDIKLLKDLLDFGDDAKPALSLVPPAN